MAEKKDQVIGVDYETIKDNFIKDCEKQVVSGKSIVTIKPLTRNKSTNLCAIQGLKYDHMATLKEVVNARVNSTGMTKKIAILDKIFFSRVSTTHDAIVLLFNKYQVYEIVIGSPEWNRQVAYWKIIDDNAITSEFRKSIIELDKMTRSGKKDVEEEEEVQIILA